LNLVSVTLATTLPSTTGLSSLSRMSHTYVTQRPIVGTLLPQALMHSPPPAGNCTMSHDQALRHEPQTVISLGKHGSDNVPDVATSIATRFLPDPSSVDIKRTCSHEDNHQQRDTSRPALQLSKTLEECAQRYLLEARAWSMDRRLFDPPSAGDRDCFYAFGARFQCARSVHTTMLAMRQNLGTWYSCPQNQTLVNMRFLHAMMTIGSWATRIRQTREQGHQADDTDVCGAA